MVVVSLGALGPVYGDLKAFDVHQVGAIPCFFVELGQILDWSPKFIHLIKIFNLG